MDEFADSEILFSEWQESQDNELMEIDDDFISQREQENSADRVENARNERTRDRFDQSHFPDTSSSALFQHIAAGLYCDGRVFHVGDGQLPSEGYLCSGLFERLLCGDDLYLGLFTGPTVQLFGAKFVTGNTLFHHQEKLFNLLRQQIFKLENLHEGRAWTLSGDGNSDCLNIRRSCNKFMMYLHYFINNCLVNSTDLSHTQSHPYLQLLAQTPVTLHKSLVALSLFIGRLCDLPRTCFLHEDAVGVISSRLPAGFHMFHVYLDVKWNVLQGLLGLLNKQDADAHLPEREELLCSIKTVAMETLWDLTAIAATIYDKAGRSNSMKSSPFPCSCVLEVWIMLVQTLDHLSSKTEQQSFWSSFTCILEEVRNPTEDPVADNQELNSFVPQSFTCADPVGFCWWIVVKVAPLYWFNRRGVYNVREKSCVPGNWLYLTGLVKSSLSALKECHEESQRRYFIRCCVELSYDWSANTGLVLWLWDYFHRRLNETFHIPGSSLQGMSIVSSSAFHWMSECHHRGSSRNQSTEAETSYTLWLEMLAVHLSRAGLQGLGWKQIKGRFYSKFHKRRMEELNETGLHNFISLFLTLSSVADLEDVATKMCSFLELLDFGTTAPAKRVFIWRGLFALMLVYKERDVDCAHLSTKMADSFSLIAKEFAEVYSRDKVRHRHLWELITLFLDCTQEVLEHSNKKNLSESALIGVGFQQLFSVCRDNELRYVLGFVQSVSNIVRPDSSNCSSRQDFSETLWTRIFPHLRMLLSDRQVVKATSNYLADTMAGFLLLSYQRYPEAAKPPQEAFLSLLRCVCFGEDLDASFCCRLLCHILPTNGVTSVLEKEGLQTSVIHTWFRCLLQLPTTHDSCQSFTRFVASLPEMSQLIGNQPEFATSTNSEKSLKIFIASLGMHHGRLTRFEENIQFRKRVQSYLGDLTKYMDPFVNNAGPQDSLRLSYFVSGYLVMHCYKVIYSKTQPHCLLPRLLDLLILPLTGKKSMHPSVVQCAKAHLHLFLQGLRSLDFKRDDFIKRKIRNIFDKYFQAVCQKWQSDLACGTAVGTEKLKNPFLVVMKDSFGESPTQEASDYREFVVELIRDVYLNLPQPHTTLTPTLYFLDQLFRRTQSLRQTARDSMYLLAPVLSCLMACNVCSSGNEPPNIRRHASDLIRMMIESCKLVPVTPDYDSRETLIPPLRSFVYNQVKEFKGLVFKTFESVAVLDPDLVASLIPDMQQAITQCEQNRGVGTDSQLRSAFKVLLQKAGRASEADWDSPNIHDSLS
ncbi:protein MMS22-like isoform X1 [Nematostella vectensis]|uniref:protein MMS22-like isoform X1 n=1 Tax=Nematostella vectensis TaxID=45351 RepID=UPI0020770537|nr:protein MMS22-like isoform X1 [Nematostella vectensis]